MALYSASRLSAVLAAILFVSAFMAVSVAMHRPAGAQAVVAPTCPQGYVLSGSRCVADNTVTSSSNGPWVFVVLRALGVRNANELDGASVCVVSGAPSELAVADYFRIQRINYEPVPVATDRAALSSYLNGACDTFLISDATADATVNATSRPNDHVILPQTIVGRSTTTTTVPATTPVPVAPQPADLAVPLQRELKRIGCLAGRVDGIWGNGSRAGLRRFAQLSGLNLGTEPSQRALTEARSRQAGYCPALQQKPAQQVYRCNRSDYAFCKPLAHEYCEGEESDSCLNRELIVCLRDEIGCKP